MIGHYHKQFDIDAQIMLRDLVNHFLYHLSYIIQYHFPINSLSKY